jgi:hypothetical protein
MNGMDLLGEAASSLFCMGLPSRWNILQRCQEEGSYLPPSHGPAMTSPGFRLIPPHRCSTARSTPTSPDHPVATSHPSSCTTTSAEPINRSVNDTSNGGTSGTAYRPNMLTSTLGTQLPTLILLVFLLGQGSLLPTSLSNVQPHTR